jgi:cell wall assembly regulator SMI1
LARLDAAEGQAVIRWLEQIEHAAMQGNWQAAAWKLERRYPDQYGRHVIQHDGQVHVTRSSEWQELRTTILLALAPYPEARAQLAEVLSQAGSQEHRHGHRHGTGA